MQQEPTDQPSVLLLNGGSSSGKSTLAKDLQSVLPGTWLRLGVDTLVEACPPRILAAGGLDLKPDGSIVVGSAFSEIELMWMAGVARMAEVGAHILIEDNFVSGPQSQQRWRAALHAVGVGWVAVRCSPIEAGRRELLRGNRTAGMAVDQAERVHSGIAYDVEVHTDEHSVRENAEFIRRRFFGDSG